MMAFGRIWTKKDIPGLFLFFALPAALIIREDNPIFWNSAAVRILPIAISLIFCFTLIPFLKHSPLRYISKPALLVTSAFLFSAILSSIQNDFPLRGAARLTEMISLAIFALYLRAAIVEKVISKEMIPLSMALVLAVLLAGIADYWNQIPTPQEYPWHTKLPFFSNIRHLGYVLAVLSPVGFIFWEKRTTKFQVLAICFSCMCWSLIVWSGGRGAALSATAVIIIYAIIKPKSLVWIIPTLLTSIAIANHFAVNNSSMDLFRTFKDLNDGKALDINDISANRITIYIETIKMWWQKGPWFGLGADAFRFINPPIVSHSFVHPHSVGLQALIHYGIVGATLLSAIVILYFRSIVAKYSPVHFIYSLPVIAALLNGATDGVFYHAIPLFYIICLLVASLPKYRLKTEQFYYEAWQRYFLTVLMVVITLLAVVLAMQIYNSKRSPSDSYISWNNKFPMYFDAYYWIVLSQRDNQAIVDLSAQTSFYYSSHTCSVINQASESVKSRLLEACRK
jgi:hypothetical protein